MEAELYLFDGPISCGYHFHAGGENGSVIPGKRLEDTIISLIWHAKINTTLNPDVERKDYIFAISESAKNIERFMKEYFDISTDSAVLEVHHLGGRNPIVFLNGIGWTLKHFQKSPTTFYIK